MIPDEYFDRFTTKKYRAKNPLQRRLIRRFVAQLHELFGRAAPARSVLEVGVGEGFLSGYLSEKFPALEFSGVDLNERDLEELKKKFERIKTYQGNVYDLSALPRGYDLVICAEVLEHLDDPLRGLDQILSLEPRYLILTVPHEPWFRLSNLARGKNISRLGNDPEHIQQFSVRSFRRLLEQRLQIQRLTTSYPWILALATRA